MTEPIIIDKIVIRGFRGFLDNKEIKTRNKDKKNLAIFAPNAAGKSSFVDALEYYFYGTIERVGKKKRP